MVFGPKEEESDHAPDALPPRGDHRRASVRPRSSSARARRYPRSWRQSASARWAPTAGVRSTAAST